MDNIFCEVANSEKWSHYEETDSFFDFNYSYVSNNVEVKLTNIDKNNDGKIDGRFVS